MLTIQLSKPFLQKSQGTIEFAIGLSLVNYVRDVFFSIQKDIFTFLCIKIQLQIYFVNIFNYLKAQYLKRSEALCEIAGKCSTISCSDSVIVIFTVLCTLII